MSSDIRSSDTPIIAARSVGKCYHIYGKPQDRLKQAFWRGRHRFYQEFWAVRDVSFDVHRGEAVGIIGRNGCGKSTLLQIIAGTLTPTEGEIRVNGRIAALLELGSGFNPDFTGRENVFMNGAILGVSRKEMENRFDDIAAFADIGEFLDQPVKIYSSGMFARLAFAVAINVDPDILIIDEILAVGDAVFQAKCFRRIDRLRQAGTTILLVTHDTLTVASMCDHGLLLDHGQVAMWGPAKQVAEEYYRRVRQIEMQSEPVEAKASPASSEGNGELETPVRGTHMGDGRARIRGFAVYDNHNRPTHALAVRARFRIDVSIEFLAALANPHVGVALRDVQSRLLLGGHTLYEGVRIGPVQTGQNMTLSFDMQMNLNPGKYLLMVGVAEHEDIANWKDCDVFFDVAEIEVHGKDRAWSLVDTPVTITVRNGNANE